MMFSAFLFDLDGTLIDSAPDILRVANKALSHLKLPALSLATIRGFVGDGLPALIRRALNCVEGRPLEAEIPDREAYQEALRVAREAYLAEPSVETIIYPGVRETLSFLEGRASLGVVTNKPYEVTVRVLEALDLRKSFGVVVGGDSLPARKPDPAPLRFALESLQKEAGRSLFIGDHPNDLLAARAADIKVALVTYGYSDRETLSALSPDYLVERFEELKTIDS